MSQGLIQSNKNNKVEIEGVVYFMSELLWGIFLCRHSFSQIVVHFQIFKVSGRSNAVSKSILGYMILITMNIFQLVLHSLLFSLALFQCAPKLSLDGIQTGMVTAALQNGDIIMSRISNEVEYTYSLKRSQLNNSPQATFGLIAFDSEKGNALAFQIRVSQATSLSLLIRLITPWTITKWRSLKFSMIVSSRNDFEVGIYNVPNWQPSQIQIAVPFARTYSNISSYIARPFLAGVNMVTRASHLSWQILQLSISETAFVVGIASNSEISGISFGYFVFSPPLAGFTSYGGIASQPQIRGTLYQVIQMSLSTLVNYAFGVVGFSASVSNDFYFSSSIDSNFILTLNGEVRNITVSFIILGIAPNATCSHCPGTIPSYNRCVPGCSANQAQYTFTDRSRGCIECPDYAYLTMNSNRTDCTCQQGYYILRGVCTPIPLSSGSSASSASASTNMYTGLSAEALQSQFFANLGGSNTTTTQVVTTTTTTQGLNNFGGNSGANSNLLNFNTSGYSMNSNSGVSSSNTQAIQQPIQQLIQQPIQQPIQILGTQNQGSSVNSQGQFVNFNQASTQSQSQPQPQRIPQPESQSQLNQNQFLLQTQNSNTNLNLNQQLTNQATTNVANSVTTTQQSVANTNIPVSNTTNRCTDPNSYFSSSTMTCYCNPGLVNINGRCQSCPAGTQFNGAQCINPTNGQIFTGATTQTFQTTSQPQVSQIQQGYSQSLQGVNQQQLLNQQSLINQQQIQSQFNNQQIQGVTGTANSGLPTSYVPTSYYPNVNSGVPLGNQYNPYASNTGNNQMVSSYIPNAIANSGVAGVSGLSGMTGVAGITGTTGVNTGTTGYGNSGLPLSYIPTRTN